MVKTILKDKTVVAYCPTTNSDNLEEDANSGKLNSFVIFCRENGSKQNNGDEGLPSFNIRKNKKFQNLFYDF